MPSGSFSAFAGIAQQRAMGYNKGRIDAKRNNVPCKEVSMTLPVTPEISQALRDIA